MTRFKTFITEAASTRINFEEVDLKKLTLDQFWECAKNGGYVRDPSFLAPPKWRSKEKLVFSKMREFDGKMSAMYKMVWYNVDEDTMEESDVFVFLGKTGKFHGEFSGTSKPIVADLDLAGFF